MHCGNTTFVNDNEFKEYMKVEGTVSEHMFYYLFDVGVRKFLFEKEKKYLMELFDKSLLEKLKIMTEFSDRLM